MTLILKREIYNEIVEHVKQEEPYEACGILVGKIHNDKRIVLKIYKSKNISKNPLSSYIIDFDTLRKAIVEADKKRWEIIGFYHSHPPKLLRPSLIDISKANWHNASYVIVTMYEYEISSWVWNDDEKKFYREDVIIL